MIWNNAMKYPALIMGLIMFGIFISNPKTKKYFSKYTQSRVPNTCMTVLNRVSKKTPKSWQLDCPTDYLLQIKIKHASRHSSYLKIRPEIYKALANYHVKLMQLSNLETLSNLGLIEFKVSHPQLSVISQSEGSSVAEMAKLNLRNHKELANHLRATVNIKEVRK